MSPLARASRSSGIDARDAAHDVSAWDPDVLAPREDDLVLLTNESMRARRRPLAVLALWAWQTGLALLVAWPAASGVAALYGAHPDRDAPLWDPGGLSLIDLVMHQWALRAETVTLLGLVLLVSAVADLVPIGALLASIGLVTRDRRPPPLRSTLARGAQAFPTFGALLAGAAGVELVVLGIALVLSSALSRGLAGGLGEARADQIAWLAGLVVAALAAVVGVTHDLARAAAIRFRVRTVRAVRLAVNTLARGPASLVWSWGWRAIAGWVPVVIGALVANRLGGRGGAALFMLMVVHQLVLLSRTALRASWLAKALRAVDHAHRVLRV